MIPSNRQSSEACSESPFQQGCDRREFLRVAAAIPAALAATQVLGADAPTDKVKPADVPMPQIKLGKYSISRLIVGSHDIDGGGHVHPLMQKDTHAYYTPERAVKTLQRCEEVGINAWQGHERGTLLGIFQRLRKAGGKMYLLGLTANMDKDLKPYAKIDGLIGIAHNGVLTDRLFKAGTFDKVGDRLKQLRDTGLLVGLSTHTPDVIDAVESKGWDVDYYQICVYERARDEAALKRLLGHVPIPVGEVYLKDDPQRTFKVIRQTKRPCLAFKILAGGRRFDVEDAFRETFAAIKPTDAVIVGIYDRYTDQAAENAAFTRRYGSRS